MRKGRGQTRSSPGWLKLLNLRPCQNSFPLPIPHVSLGKLFLPGHYRTAHAVLVLVGQIDRNEQSSKPNHAMKRLIIVGLLMLGPGLLQAQQYTDVVQQERDADVEQVLNAQRWMEAFNKLDKRHNITVVIAIYDNIIELENITEARADGRFLVLRYKHENGGTYHYLIYPTSVLLIKESPKSRG